MPPAHDSRLQVLNVAYPFAPVGPDAVGGAEQVLTSLDAFLVERGHDAWVVACEGSRSAGTLRTAALPARLGDADAVRAAHASYRALIESTLREAPFRILHAHGLDFSRYLPEANLPTLVTLHLPLAWYPPEVFTMPQVHLCCVSRAQRESAPPAARFGPDLPNGVPLEAFPPRADKAEYLLMLCRICPEKGVHLALEVAHRLDLPLWIGGQVYPYPAHKEYFETQVLPKLDAKRRFLGPVGMREKANLLSRARCLLVPSLVDETSSLVSMEAMASGTPVVALRRGALPEIVEHGVTGFVVDSLEDMVEAVRGVHRLAPKACRAAAEQRFSSRAMGERYLGVYHEIAGEPRGPKASRAPLDVQEVTRASELIALRPAWQALWHASPEATVFQRPEWLLPWCEHLLAGQLRLLTLRDGTDLVGIVPFFAWQRAGGFVLSLMGAGVSDYQDGIVFPPARARVEASLVSYLRAQAHRYVAYEWSELPPGSVLRAVGRALGTQPSIEPQEPCPWLDLPGDMADLATRLPPGMWARAQYAERRAAREGYVITEARTEADVFVLLSALLTLHGARMVQRGQVQASIDPERATFLQTAARGLLAADMLRLYGLRCTAGPYQAALLAFRDRSALRFYMSGFAGELKWLSPGNLLIAHALRAAVGEGVRCFDFLRGAEAYKYRWGARDALMLERLVVDCVGARAPFGQPSP